MPSNHQLNVRAALLRYLQEQDRPVHLHEVASYLLRTLPYWKVHMHRKIDICREDVQTIVQYGQVYLHGRNLKWYCYTLPEQEFCEHGECTIRRVHLR